MCGREVLTSPQAVRDFLRVKLGGLEHESGHGGTEATTPIHGKERLQCTGGSSGLGLADRYKDRFSDKWVAFLTEDQALALYWVGMQTHSHRRDGTSIHYAMNPHTAMFARLSDQEVQAVLKILADGGQAPV